jgi:dihydrofolate reductase
MGSPPPRTVLYIAASLDGRIATADGGVGWLDPFAAVDSGYEDFMADVGSVVLGRSTYDQALTFDPWPYPRQRTVVLTHRPLEPDPPARVEADDGSDLPALLARLRAETPGRVLLVGGGEAVGAFLDADLVGELLLFVMPVILGAGPLLVPTARHPVPFHLVKAVDVGVGAVLLHYTHPDNVHDPDTRIAH